MTKVSTSFQFENKDLRKDFIQYCVANDTTMTEVLNSYIKKVVSRHKAKNTKNVA